MARGLKWPIRVNARGGVNLTREDHPEDTLHQVVTISLIPGDTSQAWDRKDGLPAPGGVYRTPAPQGALVVWLQRRFTMLEGRAQLVGKPVVGTPDDTGRRPTAVRYLNLEVRREAVAESGV